jgi:hypothetical protein
MIDLVLKIDLNPWNHCQLWLLLVMSTLLLAVRSPGTRVFGSGGFGLGLGRAGFGLWAPGPTKGAALGTMRSGGVVLSGTLVQGP